MALTAAVAGFVRARQMQIRVTSQRLLVVNFWSARGVRWESVTGIDFAPVRSQRIVATDFKIMGQGFEHLSALRFATAAGRRLVATVSAGSTPAERSYAALLAALGRRACERGIALDVSPTAAAAGR